MKLPTSVPISPYTSEASLQRLPGFVSKYFESEVNIARSVHFRSLQLTPLACSVVFVEPFAPLELKLV